MKGGEQLAIAVRMEAVHRTQEAARGMSGGRWQTLVFLERHWAGVWADAREMAEIRDVLAMKVWRRSRD